MKRLLHISIRAVIACVLAVVTLEVAARIDDWLRFGANPVAYYGPKSLVMIDDDGLASNRPDFRYEKWQHDEHGYREYPGAVVAESAKRWICVGTSESYGLYEKPGGEWPAALGALVASQGVRVMNASVVGMSPFELPRYLDRHVLPLRPDLVVLVISPFSFTSGMGMAGTPPDSAHFADPKRIAGMRANRVPRLRDQSRFLPKFERSIRRRIPQDLTIRLALFSKERRLRRLERSGARPQILLDAPPPATVEAYLAMLDRLKVQLSEHGAELALCTYSNALTDEPTRAMRDATLDRLLNLPAYSPAGLRTVSMTFAAATRAYCDTSGTRLVDLEAAIPRSQEYFADSVHLTDVGAARAAAAALDVLAVPTSGR